MNCWGHSKRRRARQVAPLQEEIVNKPFDPERRHRRSIRLKGYDYKDSGAYFVTLVSKDRTCLFGEVIDGEMRTNEAGRMLQDIWCELPVNYVGGEG